MDARERKDLEKRRAELLSEHRDLDDVIARLTGEVSFDQLQVQRLKKRKLMLKDQIGRLEDKLVQAVRNSLNLPRLRVAVRRNRSRRSWSFCLKKDRVRSDWLELDSGSIEIMKKIGLLPALYLGVFRIAYDALRRATGG